ncbi:hypothetical protein [Huintestinicola sp.]|uniref:hypothetical protein n=1 Tax=Huintestinicola sp. TaxID=2981661 RepID=UPI003D7D40CC
MPEKSFKIDQISAGWIMGYISDGENTISFCASYLSNFLDDLMSGLIYILGRSPRDEPKNSFRVFEEPAYSIWNMGTSNEQFVFHAVTYESQKSDKEIENKTVQIETEIFLNDFIAEMQDILQRFGLYGFRSEWGYEFPLSLFLQLKDIRDKTKLLTLSEKDGSDNLGLEYCASSFEWECEFFDGLIPKE